MTVVAEGNYFIDSSLFTVLRELIGQGGVKDGIGISGFAHSFTPSLGGARP
jgi:hypothetical protein